MQVSSPLPSIQGIGSDNAVASGEITEETFLRLLTTQLQHQDPLNPTDDIEYIQQMATFAQLEQQRITNDRLNIIQLYQSSLNNSNALNIVGKDVKLADNAVKHTAEGQVHHFTYPSDSLAVKTTITVVDDKGKEVFKQVLNGNGNDGEETFTWYGQTTGGDMAEPGEYKVRVALEDRDGETFFSQVFQRKSVHGISYENGSVMVLVGDEKIPIENVVEVYQPGAGEEESDSDSSDGSPQFKGFQPFSVIAGGM